MTFLKTTETNEYTSTYFSVILVKIFAILKDASS